MKVVDQSFEILSGLDKGVLIGIEEVARTCYQSMDKMCEGSAEKLIKSLIERGHESVFEHNVICVNIITSRLVTHQLVRHRIASFAQESTRYCDYKSGGFNSELAFIRPVFWETNGALYNAWVSSCSLIERSYMWMRNNGATPEQASFILPNSLKTELVMTANIREWRHVLRLRASKKAHPQTRALMCGILDELLDFFPCLFRDVKEEVS